MSNIQTFKNKKGKIVTLTELGYNSLPISEQKNLKPHKKAKTPKVLENGSGSVQSSDEQEKQSEQGNGENVGKVGDSENIEQGPAEKATSPKRGRPKKQVN